MLWTQHLKDIDYEGVFVPTGALHNASTNKALTVGAGVKWSEAYAAVDAHRRAIVGGSCPSVGAAGGWAQGGGHSFLSPSYDLGINFHNDTNQHIPQGAVNIIQLTVVLANGQYITANIKPRPILGTPWRRWHFRCHCACWRVAACKETESTTLKTKGLYTLLEKRIYST